LGRRYWMSYEEQMDDSKASIPELEEYLEKLLVAQKYDLKAFLAVLLNTQAYQAMPLHEEFSKGDKPHFQGPYLRRMSAEQIWDSFVALVSHEPEAKNIKRNQQLERRIMVSKMVNDSFIEFGEKSWWIAGLPDWRPCGVLPNKRRSYRCAWQSSIRRAPKTRLLN